MIGYVNASLSVFRVSDFEKRSQPRTTGSELLGEAVKYCRCGYKAQMLQMLSGLGLNSDDGFLIEETNFTLLMKNNTM